VKFRYSYEQFQLYIFSMWVGSIKIAIVALIGTLSKSARNRPQGDITTGKTDILFTPDFRLRQFRIGLAPGLEIPRCALFRNENPDRRQTTALQMIGALAVGMYI
jgi:hypothetical protein